MLVRPSSATTASGWSTSKLPPTANCMSVQRSPAPASAIRAANAPMRNADFPGKRPNGWRPTPMMARSGMGRLQSDGGGGERERHDDGVGVLVTERHDDQSHRTADGQVIRAAVDEHALHSQLAGNLDEPHVPGLEVDRIGELPGIGGLGEKALRRPRPQRALPAQQVTLDGGGAAVGASLAQG